ncbi:DUF3024 domain-containing protein [Vibrio nitrifigilis]|uniref:DUF3024 domain-containing protein n=1 Tax=Vibrio nitrifigilis TaxID=2789781 RepID=A0ABS0GJE5_9VIBR|nr:DUF3024 domain-containing protein [Vibrio nitrifigilis]MBF9002561.1 DUF3024 domain-containing protein [Vibrio nitrifigilis]
MAVVDLIQRQIERRAELVCQNRNQSLPIEMGKSGFESIEQGVHFVQHHYKLDSTRCDYSSLVAKLVWQQTDNQWALYVADNDDDAGSVQWRPYPYLSKSGDLTALIREVEKDPKSIFWS